MGSPAKADPSVQQDGAGRESPGDELAPDGQSPGRHRLRLAAFAGIVVVALAVAAIVLLSSSSPAHPSAGAAVPPGETTTTVTRRTLTESSTVDGTLGYGGTHELYDRVPGTFTWLPGVGRVVGRGGTLWRIDNLPIVLMYGSVPAYRTLKAGVAAGPDVTQLNENLIDLGYDPDGAITDTKAFGEATVAAVRRWQKAEGLRQSGQVELGRVVFASGAQRVTKVHVVLGQDPPGGSGQGKEGTGSEEPSKEGEPAEKEPSKKEGAKEPSTKEKGAKRPSSKEKGETKDHGGQHSKEGSKHPGGEEKAPKESDGSTPKGSSSNGENPGGAATLALSTTSTRQIVSLQVKADQQQLAHVGESAPVTLPNGDVVRGHVTEVGTVASESNESEKGAGGGGGGNGGGGGGGGSATIPVTLELDRPVARLDQAPVSVELVKETRRDVLAVPATALVATAGGGYAIEALNGNRRVDLPVTPGMFANGYVQIEGAGVYTGLTVLQSQ